jgi:sporulation protein YlmC with PRC-barrel domain
MPTPLPVMLVTPRAPALGSELLGTPVTDFSGRTLGSVADLVVPASMELIAVVKRSDGELVCVPMSRLLARLRKPEPDAERTKLAPTADVESFIFSQDPAWLAGAESVESSAAIDAAAIQRCRETFLGRDAQAGAPGGADSGCPPWALAQLLGGTVKDSAGKQVGAVKDVAVNLSRAQAAYLVISAADTGGRLHGAATGLLHCGEDGLSLQLPMSSHELRVVFPGLDLEHLPLQPDLPSLGPAAPVADTPNS